jgi:hypothetical protein
MSIQKYPIPKQLTSLMYGISKAFATNPGTSWDTVTSAVKIKPSSQRARATERRLDKGTV